ncbi:MAG: restriction endonuclease subunit S [Fibrobacter sp.]|nr:restriction endonuclease subunit S [Fibrobacter sp.]
MKKIVRHNPHYEKLTDIPFEIPESWEWIKLMNVCEDFIVPQRDKPTEFTGNIPWCRIEDIEGKYLNGSRSHQLVTKELADKMNMHLCPKGTVISACSASIGNQAITTVDCYTNQTFIGIVCNKTLLFNEYLYYFLESQSKKLKEMGKGTTIGYISRKKYEDYAFPLPPLAEQKKIVDKIEEIFKSLDEISLHLV